MRLRDRWAALFGKPVADEAFWSALEETLIAADVGPVVAASLLKNLREHSGAPDALRAKLREQLIGLLTIPVEHTPSTPRVILVLGVNGAGKTTTCAKLAAHFMQQGQRVLLAAGDTFRAAAVQQLKTWGERLQCEVVAQGQDADAAAVGFDAVEKAKAKGYDVVIMDTAGRQHTKQNLMEELKKISRVLGKALPGAPQEKWLVIDANVGQNGLSQAREFHGLLGLTGVVLTKMDGTARGGIVCAIAGELTLPVRFVGVGEHAADLRAFDPRAFVEGWLA